jgi:CHAT domain-containing protein/Tfp pilus assembly protein PilF
VFTLTLKAKEFVQVTIDQLGIDLTVSILDPRGSLLQKTDWRWSGIESASWVTNSTGRYRIQISSRRGSGVRGEAVLSVTQLRPAAEADSRWPAAEAASTRIKEGLQKGATLAQLDESIRDALVFWRQLDFTHGSAQTLNVRGFLELASGRPVVALETLQEALSLRRSVSDTAGEAETLHNIASVESAAGDVRKAQDHYEQALELRRKSGDLEGIPATLSNLGRTHVALGETDAAIEVLAESLRVSQQLADARLEAQARVNLGATLAAAGETQEALDHFRNALTVVGKSDARAEAYVLVNLGRLFSHLGDFSRALPNLKRAAELMRTLGDRRGEASVLANIGATHYFAAEPKVAIPYLEQALAAFREAKDRLSAAHTLQGLSAAHHALGERGQAFQYNAEALEISRSLKDPRGEASSLRNLAEMEYSSRDFRAAAGHLDEARVIFGRMRELNAEAEALLALARVSRDSGNPAMARTHAEEALKLVESLRERIISSRLRGTYFAAKREYYDFYIDLLMQTSDRQHADAALEASERARSRLLLDTIPLSRIQIGNDANLNNRRRRLQREINSLAQILQSGALNETAANERSRQLESLLFELDDVQVQSLKVDRRYQQLVSPSLLSVAEIQSQLDDSTLLLEYSIGDSQSFLWAVTRTSVTAFSGLPSRSETERLVRTLHDSARARNVVLKSETARQKRVRLEAAAAVYSKTAALISAQLLGPVAGMLQEKRLVIVSDGPLHFLPFAALPRPGDPAASPLIMTHEVVNLPSLSVLAAMRQEISGRSRPSKTVAVIADPVYSRDDPRVAAGAGSNTPASPPSIMGGAPLPRLIYGRQEARRILSLVSPTQSRAVLGFDADVAAATDAGLASFQIIHFSVHGLLDSSRPALSSLVLSLLHRDGREKDGFLRLHQIYNLNLPVDLVVLGACETALGNEIRGEGLESLARGFMHAGASRLVASLWKVEDESVSELMQSFYRAVLGKSLRSPASALREAQLEIMRNPRWRDPYYWAAFVFVGEWR